MSTNAPVVDVDATLDAIRFSGLPALVVFCTATILVLDGLDIQVIAFAAPSLAAEFGVERSALGPVLAAALVGIAVGGFGVGPVGDRWGRRFALLASTTLFGAATLAAATATNLEVLTVWRFVTGIGLGGALPNATAMMAEFAPPKWRSQAIAAAIVGVPVGGMMGAAAGAEIVPLYGWRTMFVIGGALPLIAAAVMYFVLPESPRYLAARGTRRADLARLLNRLSGAQRYTAEQTFVLTSSAAQGSRAGIGALFARDYVRDTLAAWLAFATNLFAVYAFFSWTPVVLSALGYELATAVRGSLVFNLTGVVGAVVTAWLIPKFGSRWPVAAAAALGILALLYLSQLSFGDGTPRSLAAALPALMLGIAVAGFAITATQVSMYVVVAHIYPTACRASGVGWAVGVGRIGAIVSSFGGGLLLAGGGGPAFFGAVAAVLVLTLIGVLLVRRHLPPHAVPGRAARQHV